MSSSYDNRCDLVRENDYVHIRLPSQQERIVRLTKNGTANFGKFGKVPFSELIGKPYGLSFEIVDKDGSSTLRKMSPRAIEEIEDYESTNQFIEDDSTAITLLGEAEIEALKNGGVEGRHIIDQQIAAHGQFDQKTAYSKDKYLKKKEAKFLKFITLIPPTTFNVCEYHFTKNSQRIRDLRVDSLSQMLTLANVQQGGRYIVIDDTSGLLTGAILERLAGEGSVLIIHDADSPPNLDILDSMNFPEQSVKECVRYLNWVSIDDDFEMPPLKLEAKEGGDNWRSHHERDKIMKRKEQFTALDNLRKEFFDGGFDGLISASQYEPLSIIQRLYTHLSGSAPIVLHHPHLAVLTDAHMRLRNDANFLAPVISESWLRQYQVLPGRTHPNMQMPATGGYLLHTTKVFDDPNAHSIKAFKRRKAERSYMVISKVLVSAALAVCTLAVPLERRMYSSKHAYDWDHDAVGGRARDALLSTQRASWEQGTAAEALLEFDYDRLSVFNPNYLNEIQGSAEALKWDGKRQFSFSEEIPVHALSIAWDAVNRQHEDGRLGVELGGPVDGSASDPASMGPAVYLASKIWPKVEERERLGDAAAKQLSYTLNTAPRSETGAISHRTEKIAYWSDSVYMAPPLIAYAGALEHDKHMLHEAFAQIKAYREALFLKDVGLYGHIFDATNKSWEDAGAWSTGNGWIAGGMSRVLATIKHSGVEGLDWEAHHLIIWLKELLQNAYKVQKNSGLLPNYLDKPEDFEEVAGTAAITAAAYRLGAIAYGAIEDVLPQMEKAFEACLSRVDVMGNVQPTVDALDWSAKGVSSPESAAFILELLAAKEAF
ncbi:hypothetical protein E3P92_02727 [Wallemia ichthyophaga]|uniref:tRNA (adenine(58)-N(1))-methyltransferase non-catalytic subunit TRM6 n=1 Tax=Wallemia ichthyophaga (strain EXF-994 / CBS 113033) TaxID=1299270 RepID=R9AAI8_WALI9|nr:tRNA (adenine(58)-N(1))-methyltransferase non-catalytic subunit TRM6 [Wallemia ichthyophaga EXF-994]TIA69990.1 hypothetical protein E3P91_03327 [Wallemia ichthyophaga]EOQ99196.1 tRNA (adenine(58)-N(1))-methyltransferase non-catalytic subunit TRM6 [Wallemia ichthyophaga EXF-994]TIA79395.1 hypothetical protein E3P98_03312 [Wallemia ichthyophaga]TIA88107.1 hypothetical protein E3P97_03653 [Wallemia ichthyophaga]TIB12161.1 hypothetical protein E3P92_02727 [Wallemia ichthyophaga]